MRDDTARTASAMPMPRIVDHLDGDVAAEIAQLQRSAYAVEAALIGYHGIPGLTATAESVGARSALRWVAVVDDDRIVGALAEERRGDTVEIDSLVVEPALHRRGLGRALVTWSLAQPGVASWIAGTGEANTPAVSLYESLGFERFERDEALVPYVRFRRGPDRRPARRRS